ncbi:MAG: NAD(P)/FAD-dependent oxidoreductase [Acidobacteriota bacterium]
MRPTRPIRVAVVGGGPAGAHCARRLARHGLEVSLFERRINFEKPCGGGLPSRGMERFPFLRDPRLPTRKIRRCTLVSPSGRQVEVPLDDPVHIFSRADLHALLLDRAVAAGVELERGRVAGFAGRRGQGGVTWTLTVQQRQGVVERGPFDFLVAADGAAGTARRRLARPLPSSDLTQAIGCYLPGHTEGRMVLKFYSGLGGYLWVFPRPDHSSAGICAPLGRLPAAGLRRLMDDFLIRRYGEKILARAERYAALIPGPPAQGTARKVQGEGWALVGDGAGAVDPLTREGIYYAMLTGEILAGCLAAGRPQDYAEAWDRERGGEFALARRMAARFFDASFLEWLVRLCGISPAIARVLSDLIAGRQPYRTLGRRLILGLPALAAQGPLFLLAGGAIGRRGTRRLSASRDTGSTGR